MKRLLFLLAFVTCLVGFSQDVNYNGSLYTVKGKKVYQGNIEVTEKLSETQLKEITTLHKDKVRVKNAIEKLEKDQKKAEKSRKKAEKQQKKVQKALKKKEQAQKNLAKAQKKYKKERKKYEKLSKKGKIDDEAKWQKKLKSLQEKITKAEKKLHKAY